MANRKPADGPVKVLTLTPEQLLTLTPEQLREVITNAATAAREPKGAAAATVKRHTLTREDAAAMVAAGWTVPVQGADPITLTPKGAAPTAHRDCAALGFYLLAGDILAAAPTTLPMLARLWAADPATVAATVAAETEGKTYRRAFLGLLQAIANRAGRPVTLNGVTVTLG